MKSELPSIKKRLDAIESRNRNVELDKAWETSVARKVTIAILTYFTIVLFFIVMNLPRPFLNSIIPALGFILSTLSLPFFKSMWLKYKNKK